MTAPPADAAPAVTTDARPSASPATDAALAALLPALRRLDRRLAAAAARVPAVYGAHVDGDRWRGLYVDRADVERLLAQRPLDGALAEPEGDAPDDADAERIAPDAPLAWLAEMYGLEPFDVEVLVLALAPELDLRYERLYAYLHDDVTRRRPTVDLALGLLCADAAERIARRARFAADAPLVRHALVDVLPPADAGAGGAPLLAHVLAVDPQIIGVVLGADGLDARVAGACRYVRGDAARGARLLGAAAMDRMVAVARRGAPDGRAPRLAFHGERGTGKRDVAAALAARLGTALLEVDVAALVEERDFARRIATALRDGWLRDAPVYLRRADAVLRDERAPRRAELERALDVTSATVIVASVGPWPTPLAPDSATFAFDVPPGDRRRALWDDALAAADVDAPPAAIDAVASRFRLTPRQIALAAADVAAARDVEAVGAAVGAPSLLAAARRRSGRDLAALAAAVPPVHDWGALVLPDDALSQLRELCARVACRGRVLDAWGFGRTLSRGTGLNALFAGPSGTGKTMAAEVVAGELGLELYRVELAGVVSKYIGETEKNLDRVFDAAERSNAILLFDEADALFGKRSEVHDAHDRYANVEISYLLQRMEAYDGVAILSTNLKGNLDAAFVRRLAFTIHFPFPDAASRRRIWDVVWPRELPLAADVDRAALAERFALSGGNVKNVALAAAFLAAGEDAREVAMRHVLAAVRREYQKLGKTLSEAELGAEAS